MRYTITLKWSNPVATTDIENDSSIIPEKGGVYELLVAQQEGGPKRRYIGQAADLRSRLLQHLSKSEENDCIKEKIAKYKCWFDYALLNSEADRKDAEQALYDKYESEVSCNEKRPEGSGRGYTIDLIEINPG